MCAQSCPTLCDPLDCSSPGSSVHGISQARILEWVAIPYSRGSSRPRDRTHVSCIGRRILHCATREARVLIRVLFNQCTFPQWRMTVLSLYRTDLLLTLEDSQGVQIESGVRPSGAVGQCSQGKEEKGFLGGRRERSS